MGYRKTIDSTPAAIGRPSLPGEEFAATVFELAERRAAAVV
jgi:hypothetical protein